LTIPSPNLKNDFYGCWVEAQNPRNALGFASLNPTYKNGEGIVLRNRVSDRKERDTVFGGLKKPGF
jgi:hypothetical protein